MLFPDRLSQNVGALPGPGRNTWKEHYPIQLLCQCLMRKWLHGLWRYELGIQKLHHPQTLGPLSMYVDTNLGV